MLGRLHVLDIIRTSEHRHLTAEEIYRRLGDHGDDVALATVYRVLSNLEAAGLVTRSVFDGSRAVYELNTAQHHDHLVCVGCGLVAEFRDDDIEARQRAVAQARGFELAAHSLALYGMCSDCQGGVRGGSSAK